MSRLNSPLSPFLLDLDLDLKDLDLKPKNLNLDLEVLSASLFSSPLNSTIDNIHKELVAYLCIHCELTRVAQLLTQPVGQARSGQRIYKNIVTGRIQFGQKVKFNFTLKYLGICILFCILVCTVFQLYIQYLSCSFQRIIGDVTDIESLSASCWHDYFNCWLHQL